MIYIPARGDAIWINFDPQVGHEQAGRRPGVVLSPQAYNQRLGLALVCPVTSRVKGYPFEVVIPPNLPVSGVVLCDQIRNVDWRGRNAEFITSLSPDIVLNIIAKLKTLLSG